MSRSTSPHRMTTHHKSAFYRIASVATPPELILHHDSEEEEEEDDDTSSWSSLQPTCCSDCESPTCFGGACSVNMLATIRKHLALARQQQQQQQKTTPATIIHPQRPRLYRPQQRQVTQIKVPLRQPLAPPPLAPSPPPPPSAAPGRRHPASSSRSTHSSNNKTPCQACREPADSCMRKAFNWPFATTDIYYDKGRPYVYLCNKCGLRYNKSGGCVCRHCRWVLCKEEKRKAVQHIAYMRRTQDQVGPDDPIVDFVCTPKYWVCGQPWMVGWVTEHDGDPSQG